MDKGNMDTTLITVGTTAPIWVQVLNNTASTSLKMYMEVSVTGE